MRNRIISILFVFVFTFSVLSANAVAQYDGKISSDYAILVDADSGIVLYEKDAHAKTYPASTTKILTCLIVLENCENIRSTEVTVGDVIKKYGEGNSLMGLTVGEVLTVRDLLYGLMLCSGNDAAAVLAEFIGGDFEGFAQLMNEKIKELGMTDTHFVTPHGLHDDEHYTTAYDMSVLVRYAMKNGDLMAIVGSPTYTVPETNKRESRTLTTTNRFISPKSKYKDFNWDVVTGMKTGYTGPAGGCLITTATQDGKNLICIIMGDRSGGQEDRWKDAKKLLTYGFENLTSVSLDELNPSLPSVMVENASNSDESGGELGLTASFEGISIPCTLDTRNALLDGSSAVSVELNLDGTPTAPIEEGQRLGSANVMNGTELLATVDVFASRSVAQYVAPTAALTPDGEQIDGTALIGGKVTPISNGGTSWYFIAALVIAVVIVFAIILRLWLRSQNNKRKKAAKRNRY